MLLLLVNPLLIGLTLLAGRTLCAATKILPHQIEMLEAAAVFLVASEAAVLLYTVQQPRNATASAQAALMSLVLHLMLSVAGSIGMMLLVHPGRAFVWWGLVLFWVTLGGVGGCLIVALRRAAKVGLQTASETLSSR